MLRIRNISFTDILKGFLIYSYIAIMTYFCKYSNVLKIKACSCSPVVYKNSPICSTDSLRLIPNTEILGIILKKSISNTNINYEKY